MRHLPSIEALMDADDRRLLAELELCQVIEKLARVRALVDRADHLLATVLACGTPDNDTEPEDAASMQSRLYAAVLSTLGEIKRGVRR